MSELDFIKINFYSSKDTVKKMKGQFSVWEEICANHISYKWLLSRIHKEHLPLNNKKNKSQFKREEGWKILHQETRYEWQINTWIDAQHH